jgi:hypothetical protein
METLKKVKITAPYCSVVPVRDVLIGMGNGIDRAPESASTAMVTRLWWG